MTIDEAIQRYEEAVQWEQYSMRSENINKAAEHRQLAEWLKELKRLRAQEPCEDAVSRQAAIDVLSLGKEILSRVLDDIDVVGTDREKYSWGLGLIESNIKDIEELPSVTPQRTGKWIDDNCSECGFYVYHGDMRNFCPKCGAKMNGGNQNE